eukprot:GHVS01084964.1.p1 GENE.GHVS01084964.1~~GHVS01084964.1.p1  ORF type:complete len:617 (+),score=39.37 GHVS01084964.1:409-2259(+)
MAENTPFNSELTDEVSSPMELGSHAPTLLRAVELPSIRERHPSPAPLSEAHPSPSRGKLVETGLLAELRLWYNMNRSVVGHSVSFLYVLTLWLIMFDCCKPYYFVFFAYLTNWGLTMCVLYFFCGLFHDARRRFKRRVLFFGKPGPPPLPPPFSALFADSPLDQTTTPKSTAPSESTCDASIASPSSVAVSPSRSPCKFGVNFPAASFSMATQRAAKKHSTSYYCTYYDPSSSLSSLWWKIFHQSLGELTFVVQVVIVTFFWIVVFPHEPSRPIWWECQTHGMPLVLMMLDYAYRTFHRFSLRNLKWILLFGVTFLFCHMCVVLFSGEPIYPGINFRDVRSFMISLLAICMLVTTHKAVYLYSNWDRIKREVKSLIGLLYVIVMGMEGSEVSPLISLWNTLSTKTNSGVSTGRGKKWWWAYVYGQAISIDRSLIVSAYTAKWAASSPASMEALCRFAVPTNRLVKRKTSDEGSRTGSSAGDTVDVYDEQRSKSSATMNNARSRQQRVSVDSSVAVCGAVALIRDHCKSGSDTDDGPSRARRRRSNVVESLSNSSRLGEELTSGRSQVENKIVSKERTRPLSKYRSHSHDYLDMLEAEATANFGGVHDDCVSERSGK